MADAPCAIQRAVLYSVLEMNLLPLDQRKADQLGGIKIFAVHVDCGNLVILIGGVVIDSLARIAAGGVERDFVMSLTDLTAAALLIDGAENMEELADALRFGVPGEGMRSRKGHTGKTGRGGEVAGKAESSHAAAVRLERNIRSKGVGRLLLRKSHVLIQKEELHRERRIVGENTDRVVINVKPVCHGFDNDRAGGIGDDPVELRSRKLRAERSGRKDHAGKCGPCFCQSGTGSENPGNEFKLCDIGFSIRRGGISGISDKVQSCHAKALLIDRVVVERILIRNVSHAENGIVLLKRREMAEGKGEIPWCDDKLFTIGKLVIE